MSKSTLDRMIERELASRLEDADADYVAQCGVCHDYITRLEMMVMGHYENPFGCVRCQLGKHWTRKQP